MFTYVLIALLLILVVLAFIVEFRGKSIGDAFGVAAALTCMGTAVIFLLVVVASIGQVGLTIPELTKTTKVHQIAKGSDLDIGYDKYLKFIAVDDQGKPYSVETPISAGLEFTGDGTDHKEVEITEINKNWGTAVVPWANTTVNHKVIVR